MNTDLKALYKLLRAKSRWTQGAWARDKKGDSVNPRSNAATCWCLLGGIEKVTSSYRRQDSMKNALRESADNTFLVRYNDGCSHQELLAVIKGAMK